MVCVCVGGGDVVRRWLWWGWRWEGLGGDIYRVLVRESYGERCRGFGDDDDDECCLEGKNWKKKIWLIVDCQKINSKSKIETYSNVKDKKLNQIKCPGYFWNFSKTLRTKKKRKNILYPMGIILEVLPTI